jgi:alkylation response protein AidB-like acyl-CoA dehydrogenase
MQLALTEDQTMLAQTASSFVTEHSPVSRFRKLRDDKDEHGYSRALYSQMAELGWTAIPFAEADGGMDMGLAGLIVVTEALGRGLAPEPLISSIAFAGSLVSAAGTAQQKQAYLEPAIAGEKVLAVAYSEDKMRADVSRIALQAKAAGDGHVLDGQKVHVLDGHHCHSHKRACWAKYVCLFDRTRVRHVAHSRLQRMARTR